MSQNKSISAQEVADILHVSKSTIYVLIRRGEINSYKIGRKVRFTQDDVDAYIARSRTSRAFSPCAQLKSAAVFCILRPPTATGRCSPGRTWCWILFPTICTRAA